MAQPRHFFAIAALLMRQILVDAARRRDAAKRGSGHALVTFDEALEQAATSPDEFLALDAALFSNAPGDDTRPAGLLNGVPPLVPTPAGPEAMERAFERLEALNEKAARSLPEDGKRQLPATISATVAEAQVDVPSQPT